MIKSAPRFNRIFLYLLILSLLLPGFCQAAVFINEVAWMGSAASPNHEWIELYNDGIATNVDGWVLSDDRNLSVELSGTIPANTYAVLERTSDESAPGAAFLIYTGALNNAGGTLRLESAQGQLVDLVNSGENWELIGGDNTTKETAQYSPKGWITAVATPGAQNKSESTVVEPPKEAEKEEGTQTTSAKSQSKKSVQTVPLTLPDVTLALEIDAQSVGYVNQTISFLSEARGIGKHLLNSLQYQWNFGDGNTAHLSEANHRFAFPGTYVVTLHAEFKRQKQITRHEITILPVVLSLTQNTQGDIQLNNDSPYELDISGYLLKAGEDFIFPEYSLILPNQTITIPRKVVGNNGSVMAAVYDAHKQLLATTMPKEIYLQSFAQVSAQPVALSSIVSAQNTVRAVQPAPTAGFMQTAFAAEDEEVTTVSDDDGASSKLITTAVANENSNSVINSNLNRNERLSYVGLVIVILLGIFGVYLAPRRNEI